MRRLISEDPQRLGRLAGGQDVASVAESPLLSGRVVALLAAQPGYRKPPYVTAPGLLGRICIVAEVAHDLELRDGGLKGTVASEVYGLDRKAPPSIRGLETASEVRFRAILGHFGPVLGDFEAIPGGVEALWASWAPGR